MLRPLLFAIALLLPTAAHAQYLQEEYTADYSLRTTLTKISDTEYLYSAQFRNEQLFEPNRVVGIANVSIYGFFYAGSGRIDRASAGQIGTIYHGPLGSGNPLSAPYQLRDYFYGTSTNGTGSAYFGSGTSDFNTGGYGLLGCSVPIIEPALGGAPYDGSTCASLGYTGWRTIEIRVLFTQPMPNFSTNGMRTVVSAQEKRMATYDLTTVPEPGTYVLVAFGLAAVGFGRRRRIASA